MTKLDAQAGEAGKLAGMAAAEAAAAAGWISAAIAAIRWLSLRYPFLCSDDLWAAGLGRPVEPRALGPCFIRAHKLGLVDPTSRFVLTLQSSRHRAPIRVWRSKLMGECGFVEGGLYSRQLRAVQPAKGSV